MEIEGLTLDTNADADSPDVPGEEEFRNALSRLKAGNYKAAVEWAEQGAAIVREHHGMYPSRY